MDGEKKRTRERNEGWNKKRKQEGRKGRKLAQKRKLEKRCFRMIERERKR